MSLNSYPLLTFPIFPLNSCFFVHKICTMVYCLVPYQSDFLFFLLNFLLLQVLVELYIMVCGMDQYVPCSLALVNFNFMWIHKYKT